MEENSGVKFEQAQVALARQWIGDMDKPSDPTNVTVVVPSDASVNNRAVFQKSSKDKDKAEPKTLTLPLPSTVDEAREIIEKFEGGARGLRSDEDVSDNVVQHMLHDNTSLLDEKWMGTDEEEKSAYVSELLYIHSKVMIVDDQRVIVSALPLSHLFQCSRPCRRWALPTSTIAARR